MLEELVTTLSKGRTWKQKFYELVDGNCTIEEYGKAYEALPEGIPQVIAMLFGQVTVQPLQNLRAMNPFDQDFFLEFEHGYLCLIAYDRHKDDPEKLREIQEVIDTERKNHDHVNKLENTYTHLPPY